MPSLWLFLQVKHMKYLVPPIMIPVLLFIGVVAYATLRPSILVSPSPAPAMNMQSR